MSTGIRNTVIVLVYTGLESSCKDWKLACPISITTPGPRLESSCKDWKHVVFGKKSGGGISLRIFL